MTSRRSFPPFPLRRRRPAEKAQPVATVSAKTGILLALLWTCLVLSSQARSSGLWENITARASEHRLLIPAMRVDAFSGGRGILISESGIESVRLGGITGQSVSERHWRPAQQMAAGLCANYTVTNFNSQGVSE